MDQIYDKATDSANFKDLDILETNYTRTLDVHDASSQNHKNTRYSII